MVRGPSRAAVRATVGRASEVRGSLAHVTPPDARAATALSRWLLVVRLAALVTAVVAAWSAWRSWASPEDASWQVVALLAAPGTAVTAFTGWVLDERRGSALRGAARSAEQLLEAERVRIATVTNGAFLSTLQALQALSGLDAQGRREAISGVRQRVVERACDLVRNEHPRAAYFTVADLEAQRRVMTPEGGIAQRARTDEFTSEFVEADDRTTDVWELVDEGDAALLREDVALPGKAYHSYISAPVRAGGVAFGVLTLNVLERGGLGEEDRDFVLVLARLLAVAESLALSPAETAAARRATAARAEAGPRSTARAVASRPTLDATGRRRAPVDREGGSR